MERERENMTVTCNIYRVNDTILPAQADSFSGITLSTFEPVTEAMVKLVITKSAPKTCSLDPIPTPLLLEILDCLLPSLTAPESGSIPLRNWIFLLIPSPIPELELNWNWLYSVQAELELNWNCHHLNWNWSRNCFLRN